MRPLLHTVSNEMPGIAPDWWAEAAQLPATLENHELLLASCPALQTLRLTQAERPALPRRPLKIGAWNLERLKHVEATADLLRHEACDILLLSEVDIGMARSGNRDTVADLANHLDMGSVYATEFVELGLGDPREVVWHAGDSNRVGLHGNACLSRFTIEDAVMIPLDDGGIWFQDGESINQRRVGTRNAVGIKSQIPEFGPLWTFSAHFESRHTAAERSSEMRRLLNGIQVVAGDNPVVLGGDLNTGNMPRDVNITHALMTSPDTLINLEPLFGIALAEGYTWATANTPNATMRAIEGRPDDPPFRKIDWFFTKGMIPQEPSTIPAQDIVGQPLSDHELITLTLR